jgi:hypothetical protein
VPDTSAARTDEQDKSGFGLRPERGTSLDRQWWDLPPRQLGRRQGRNLRLHRNRPFGFGWPARNGLTLGSRSGYGWRGFGPHGLSEDRRDYPAGGGISFFLGDGRLNDRPETILKTYCRPALSKGSWISMDWQRITSPAYNADRGPVNLAAIRLTRNFDLTMGNPRRPPP